MGKARPPKMIDNELKSRETFLSGLLDAYEDAQRGAAQLSQEAVERSAARDRELRVRAGEIRAGRRDPLSG